ETGEPRRVRPPRRPRWEAHHVSSPGTEPTRSPFDPTDVERLVGDIELGPYIGEPVDPLAQHPAEPVTVTAGTAPLLVLRDLIADPRFPALFARALRAADPDFRGMFPRDPAPVLAEFVRAMTFVLETTEAAAAATARTDEVVELARPLGADHRERDLPPSNRVPTGDARAATLPPLAGSGWTEAPETTLSTAYRVVSTALQQGAASGHGPARVGATVVGVLRTTRDV